MDNVFNINRFGKYFLYDLRNLWNRFGLSIIIMGLVPLILYLTVGIFSSLAMQGWVAPELPARIGIFWIPFVAICLIFGAKTYGFLTKRSAGSQWLLLPASRLEKFVSMLLISFVVMPFAFLGIYMLTDWLICLADPNCGQALITLNINQFIANEADGFIYFPANGLWLIWAAAVQMISVFLLGALCFRKGKVGKTILALLIFGTVLSWVGIAGISEMDVEQIVEQNNGYLEDLEFRVNLCMWIAFAIYAGGSTLASWFRIKTLKH